MKSRLLGAACVLSLVFSIPAHAATVNGSGGVATSIDNLIIGSTTYNVTFTNLGNPPGNSFNDVFSTIPTFWGDGADATDAMTAINAVLNGGPWLNVGSPDNDNDYLIPYQDVSTDSVKSARGRNPLGTGSANPPVVGGWVNFDPFTTLKTNSTVTWVQFSAVPIPAAVWLFGSGLLGLVGMARRKKV